MHLPEYAEVELLIYQQVPGNVKMSECVWPVHSYSLPPIVIHSRMRAAAYLFYKKNPVRKWEKPFESEMKKIEKWMITLCINALLMQSIYIHELNW